MKILPLLLIPALSISGAEKITYQNHIFPILEQSCLNCHNPDKMKGDLDLSSYPAVLAGGSGGKVVIPGDGASSKLYSVTCGLEEPEMPPKGDPIDRESSDLLRAWIDGGLLESKNSTAKKLTRPKFDLTIDPNAGKPNGPPPMPPALLAEPNFLSKGPGLVKAMASSPWAPLLAFTGQKQILLYHSETFRFLGSLPFSKGQPEDLTFHPSGKYLLACGGIAGRSGQVQIWDITSGKELLVAGREFDSILASALSPDLTRIALGGPSRLLKIWNTSANKESAAIKKHSDWITAMAASPNGEFFASGDRNGGIHVWDPDGNEVHSLRSHSEGITDLAFRSDSKLLASTGDDGQLIIWSLKSGSTIKKINAHNGGATSLHYHRDGRIITGGRDRSVKVFKANFSQEKSFPNLPEIVTTVSLSQSGKQVFASTYDGQVLVYDFSNNKTPLTTLDSNPPPLQERLRSLKEQLANQTQQVLQMRSTFERQSSDLLGIQTRIQATRNALQNNEKQLQAINAQQKKEKQRLREIQTEKKALVQPFNLARKTKTTTAQKVKNLEKKIRLSPKDDKGKKQLTTQLTQTKKERNQAEAKENKLVEQRHKLEKERNKLKASSQLNNQRRLEISELIQSGRKSLKELEGKLTSQQKQLAHPKKKLQKEKNLEQKLKAEITYWEKMTP